MSIEVGFDWGSLHEFDFTTLSGAETTFTRSIDNIHYRFTFAKIDRQVLLTYFSIGSGHGGAEIMFEFSLQVEEEEMDMEEEIDGMPWHVMRDFFLYRATVHGEWFFEDHKDANAVLGISEYVGGYDDVVKAAAQLLSSPITLEFPHARDTFGSPLSLSSVIQDVFRHLLSETTLEKLSIQEDARSAVYRGVHNLLRPYIEYWAANLNYYFLRGNLEHTGTIRSTTERVYTSKTSRPRLLRALASYVDAPALKNRGLKKQLSELGLGDLRVSRIERGAYTIELEKGGVYRHLADLGYGYTQLIPLLLEAYVNEQWFATLMLEEPEANLHPNLQSRLADVLHGMAKSKRRLLIETHSEYLIRRLQYLVARGEVNPSDVVIYYFGPDPEADDYIRKIEITATGQLSQDFGAGFIDESTNLMMDLYRVSNQN
jgi:hypothetical protein